MAHTHTLTASSDLKAKVIPMANIGVFQKAKTGYSGCIRTLFIDAEVVLVPAKKSDTENAPDFRIHIDDKDSSEVGAAWKETGEKAGDYLSLQLDDPTLAQRVPREPVPERRERKRLVAALDPPEAAPGAGVKAMRNPDTSAVKIPIPMFAKNPAHPAAPLVDRTDGARALPSTVASTPAGWRRSGNRAVSRYAALVLIGVLSASQFPTSIMAQTPEQPMPAVERMEVDPHAAHIGEASQRFDIPEPWIAAVLRAESAGDVRAISSAGAMGLMQVMPATWTELRDHHGLGVDPYDARDNILAGAAYLRAMWDRYGNVAAMLAAYNAGPGRYDEYLATGRALPAETRAYVAALLPVLGGAAAPEPLVGTPPTPLDWREAPLFAMRSADARTAVPAHESVDAEAETGGIFVVRANAGATPW
jgi:soluble lytic murein transglycosylase-like protein/uncharacterized protein (DUF736 family)